MTMTEPNERIDMIQKLLAKAEGTDSEEERDAFNAKATELMIKWGIEEAMLVGQSSRLKTEEIVRREVEVQDVPKMYSHEYTTIGSRIAEVLGCRGFLMRRGSRTNLIIVGFESDADRIIMLYRSLIVQCTLDLQRWYRAELRRIKDMPYTYATGNDKYNMKRGFISGFAVGVAAKLKEVKKVTVAQSGHGAELVLVDRGRQVDSWITGNMRISNGRTRSYDSTSRGAGYASGQRANVGEGTLDSGRRGIGGA